MGSNTSQIGKPVEVQKGNPKPRPNIIATAVKVNLPQPEDIQKFHAELKRKEEEKYKLVKEKWEQESKLREQTTSCAQQVQVPLYPKLQPLQQEQIQQEIQQQRFQELKPQQQQLWPEPPCQQQFWHQPIQQQQIPPQQPQQQQFWHQPIQQQQLPPQQPQQQQSWHQPSQQQQLPPQQPQQQQFRHQKPQQKQLPLRKPRQQKLPSQQQLSSQQQQLPPQQPQQLQQPVSNISMPTKNVSTLQENSDNSVTNVPASKAQKSRVFEQKKKRAVKANETNNLPSLASIKYCVDWTDIDYIQDLYGLSRSEAENIIALFKDNNTIPFIIRYRKYMLPTLDTIQLRNVKNSYEKVNLIRLKANNIIDEIVKQGTWTPKIQAFINGTKSHHDLDQIQSIYNSPRILINKAKSVGLNKTARAVRKGLKIDPLCDLVKPNTDGLKTVKQVTDGIVSILVDMINKNESIFHQVKFLRNKHKFFIETQKYGRKNDKQEDDDAEYKRFYKFSMNYNNLKPHEILEINRGEEQKKLDVKVIVPNVFEKDLKEYCVELYRTACDASPLHRTLLTAAFDSISKSIKRSFFQRIRNELTERAENDLINEYTNDIKRLLLTPPVRQKLIVGVYPSSTYSCTLALVSNGGKVLEIETIEPHYTNNPNAKQQALATLKHLLLKHNCGILVTGSSNNCFKTRSFLAELIKKDAFMPLKVVGTMVDENVAANYSCTKEASLEFPNLDASSVSAICLARRLQDPMVEIVKVDPKCLLAGEHKHLLSDEQLVPKLNEVIEEVVSLVGVDINTASLSLLKRVAGLDETKASNIIKWRKSSGPLKTRNDLKRIPGIDAKTFEQCSGFLKIIPDTISPIIDKAAQNSMNPLDQTWIHPEYYDLAQKFFKHIHFSLLDIVSKSSISDTRLARSRIIELARILQTHVETIEMIVEALSIQEQHDIRGKIDESVFRLVDSANNLQLGTIVTGTVKAIQTYGAFVSVGRGTDGLLHNTNMDGKTLTVGQRVETKVIKVTDERGRIRIGLKLVKCL